MKTFQAQRRFLPKTGHDADANIYPRYAIDARRWNEQEKWTEPAIRRHRWHGNGTVLPGHRLYPSPVPSALHVPRPHPRLRSLRVPAAPDLPWQEAMDTKEEARWRQLLRGQQPLVFPPHQSGETLFDLDDYACCYTEIVLRGPDLRLEILWDESLYDPPAPPWNSKSDRSRVDGKRFRGFGDLRIRLLCQYALSGDLRLARHALRQFDWSRQRHGWMSSRYPTRRFQLVPSFILKYALALEDYALWADDAETIRELLPGMRYDLDRILGFRKGNGLVSRLPGWGFVDSAPAWPNGVPPGSAADGSTSLNLLLLLALQAAARLESYQQQEARSRIFEAEAEALGQAITAQRWRARPPPDETKAGTSFAPRRPEPKRNGRAQPPLSPALRPSGGGSPRSLQRPSQNKQTHELFEATLQWSPSIHQDMQKPFPQLSEKEKDYLFDLQGFLVIDDALSESQLGRIDEWVEAQPKGLRNGDWIGNVQIHSYGENDGINYQNIIEGGAVFEELMDHPAWIGLVKRYVENDFAKAALHETFLNIRGKGGYLELHSGGHVQGPVNAFRHFNGAWNVGQINILMALTDVGPDDGPTVVVPGSHNCRFPHPMFAGSESSVYDTRKDPPDTALGAKAVYLKRGQALFFTDAITHGGSSRVSPGERRVIIYRYSPSKIVPRYNYQPSKPFLERLTHARRELVANMPPPRLGPGLERG